MVAVAIVGSGCGGTCITVWVPLMDFVSVAAGFLDT